MCLNICKSASVNLACVLTYTKYTEWVNCANSRGYRSQYSDLLIDSNGITERDKRQLWCKWRQLFVYIVYTLDGWWGCIIPPIVSLAAFDMLPYNNEPVWCIPSSGRLPHKGIVDGGTFWSSLTDQAPPPQCNLLNSMCLCPCGIVILAGHGPEDNEWAVPRKGMGSR